MVWYGMVNVDLYSASSQKSLHAIAMGQIKIPKCHTEVIFVRSKVKIII